MLDYQVAKLKRVAYASPTDPSAQLRVGLELERLGDYFEAGLAYAQAAKVFPNDKQVQDENFRFHLEQFWRDPQGTDIQRRLFESVGGNPDCVRRDITKGNLVEWEKITTDELEKMVFQPPFCRAESLREEFLIKMVWRPNTPASVTPGLAFMFLQSLGGSWGCASTTTLVKRKYGLPPCKHAGLILDVYGVRFDQDPNMYKRGIIREIDTFVPQVLTAVARRVHENPKVVGRPLAPGYNPDYDYLHAMTTLLNTSLFGGRFSFDCTLHGPNSSPSGRPTLSIRATDLLWGKDLRFRTVLPDLNLFTDVEGSKLLGTCVEDPPFSIKPRMTCDAIQDIAGVSIIDPDHNRRVFDGLIEG